MKKRKKDTLLDRQITNNGGHYFVTILFERDGNKYQGKGQGGRPEVAYGRSKKAGVLVGAVV